MSEKARFYNMTKPIKFRALRRFVKSIGLTYEVGKEKIKYLFNYLLYKLNIYKRCNYRDNVVTEFDLSEFARKDPASFHKVVNSTFITAHVSVRAIKDTFILRDYFYYINKKGETVKTYVVRDMERSSIKFTGRLDHIGVRIAVDEPFHFTQDLPHYRIMKPQNLSVTPITNDVQEQLVKPEYTEYVVNLTPVRSLRYQHCKELYDGEPTKGELLYVYNLMADTLEKALNDFKFTDLLEQVR